MGKQPSFDDIMRGEGIIDYGDHTQRQAFHAIFNIRDADSAEEAVCATDILQKQRAVELAESMARLAEFKARPYYSQNESQSFDRGRQEYRADRPRREDDVHPSHPVAQSVRNVERSWSPPKENNRGYRSASITSENLAQNHLYNARRADARMPPPERPIQRLQPGQNLQNYNQDYQYERNDNFRPPQSDAGSSRTFTERGSNYGDHELCGICGGRAHTVQGGGTKKCPLRCSCGVGTDHPRKDCKTKCTLARCVEKARKRRGPDKEVKHIALECPYHCAVCGQKGEWRNIPAHQGKDCKRKRCPCGKFGHFKDDCTTKCLYPDCGDIFCDKHCAICAQPGQAGVDNHPTDEDHKRGRVLNLTWICRTCGKEYWRGFGCECPNTGAIATQTQINQLTSRKDPKSTPISAVSYAYIASQGTYRDTVAEPMDVDQNARPNDNADDDKSKKHRFFVIENYRCENCFNCHNKACRLPKRCTKCKSKAHETADCKEDERCWKCDTLMSEHPEQCGIGWQKAREGLREICAQVDTDAMQDSDNGDEEASSESDEEARAGGMTYGGEEDEGDHDVAEYSD